ncbi:KAP-like P-loop domain-containing protein [Humibacillus xanthopallidus]|uniref:KAP-like P-loop domain-containing protein n=1 Tax=Humibacillus xanthopallidus TaxID=412689 RepID=A0A543PYA4_9MICO|nr:KAP family NTPase [Humibacillus xanthopallidus]TQN49063.1 KAP-like P-loop domain-containing protein [Humibacillus xanthopallidus]
MFDATWNDEPLSGPGGDTLATSHVAKTAADVISAAHSAEGSVVFGLSGPWGSGKTSLIEMTRRYLTDEHSSQGWRIVDFTPWSTSGVDVMLTEFYATIASALPTQGAKTARKALTGLVQVSAIGLKAVPGAGPALSGGAEALAKRLTATNWQRSFNAVSMALRDLGLRILVIVDDIDRLQRDELVALLKVVRLLGRFPGVTYLLAYDEGTLFSNLQSADLGAEGREGARLFMEKIVQYPLTVPPLLRSQMLNMLDSGIASALSELEREINEADYRLSMHVDEFESQLTTPRSVARFLAQIRLHLSMHAVGEIDDVDLILLTFLRVQFPDVYARLPRWRRRLTHSPSMWEMASESNKSVDWSPLTEGIGGEESRADARAILTSLFPAIKGDASREGPHVSSTDYFNRYFVHAVPPDDISDSMIDDALQQAMTQGAGIDRMSSMLNDANHDRADLAYRKLVRHPLNKEPSTVSTVLIENVMSILPELDDRSGRGILGLTMRDNVVRWAGDLLRRLGTGTPPSVVAAAVSACGELSLRLNVLWMAARTGESEAAVPLPLTDAVAQGVRDAFPEFLRHLELRDAAPAEQHVHVHLDFVAAFGDVDTAKNKIYELLDREVTVEDVAARCLTLQYLYVEKPVARLGDFDQSLFARFAPAEDQLYTTDIVANVDREDLSWANRRRYVRGRVKAPM